MTATSHIVSMRTRKNAQEVFLSVAVCECGWKNEVPFGKHEEQDAAIEAHWQSVNFKPEISG